MRYLLIPFILFISVSVNAEIIRPEDQGEDFSQFDNAENFKILTTSEDTVERWKAAKVLGTRYLNGSYIPSLEEQEQIDEYVAFLLTQFQTDNPGDAGDASIQLQRLWSLAVPGLFEGLKSKDRITWNAALEYLVRMRSESVVEQLVNEYKNTDDVEYKAILLDAIGKMRTMYDGDRDYRKMMTQEQSKELADKIIAPFLIELSQSETNEQLKNMVSEAKNFIDSPIDSRIRLVPQKIDEQAISDIDKVTHKPLQISNASLEQETKRQEHVLVPVVVAVIIIGLLVGGIVIFIRRH